MKQQKTSFLICSVRHEGMDISSLIKTILQISIGCSIVFSILNFLKQQKKNLIITEIKNLEARMSSLRLILKAKVKKKSNYFRSVSPTAIKPGDAFDGVATDLADLPFEDSDDFEKYFTLSKQLNKLIQHDISQHNASAEDSAPGKKKIAAIVLPTVIPDTNEVLPDFMTADIKNEFAIIKAIHDMIGLSVTLKSKVDHFNSMNPHAQRNSVKIIQFPSVLSVQKIFSMHNPEPTVDTEKNAA